jgi:hypothetical protein
MTSSETLSLSRWETKSAVNSVLVSKATERQWTSAKTSGFMRHKH